MFKYNQQTLTTFEAVFFNINNVYVYTVLFQMVLVILQLKKHRCYKMLHRAINQTLRNVLLIKISFNMQNEFIWVLCRIFVTREIYIPLTPSIAFSTTEGIMQNYFKNAIPVLFDHLTLKPNLTAKNRDKRMLKYYRKTTLLKMYGR